MKKEIKDSLYGYLYSLRCLDDINNTKEREKLTDNSVNRITNIFYFYFARIIITMLVFNIWFLLLIYYK